MWIRRAEVRGFGKIVSAEIDFSEGLNCIYGPNEAGKTTLLKFLLSMLYGQARPGQDRRYLDTANEKYIPWDGSTYGGRILYCLASGGEYLAVRDFSGKADTIELLDASTGADALAGYSQDRTREYQFAAEETKVDKRTYEGVFVIGHDSAGAIPGEAEGSITDRLVALADSGETSGGSDRAATILHKALTAIGTERAPKQPWALVRAEIEKARQLMARVNEARDAYSEALARRGDLSKEVSEDEAKIESEKALLTHSITAALALIDVDRAALEEEEKTLIGAGDLPEDITAEAVAHAEATLEATAKSLSTAETTEVEAARLRDEAERGLESVGPLSALREKPLRAAEGAVADFVESRRVLEDKLSRLEAIAARVREIQEKWGAEYSALAAIGPEDESFLGRADRMLAELSGQESHLSSHISSTKADRRRARFATTGCAAAAGLAAVGAVLAAMFLDRPAGLYAAAGLAGLAGVSAFLTFRKARHAKSFDRTVRLSQDEHEEITTTIARMEKQVDNLTGPFADRDIISLRNAYADFKNDYKAVAALNTDAGYIEKDQAKALDEVEKAVEEMSRTLPEIGLPLAGSLATAVSGLTNGESAGVTVETDDWEELFEDCDSASTVRTAFAPLWEKCREGAQCRSHLETASTSLEKASLAAMDARKYAQAARASLDAILARAGADDVPGLRKLMSQRERLREVRDQLRKVATREDIALGGMSRGAFQAEAGSLQPPADDVELIPEEGIARLRRQFEERRSRFSDKKARYVDASATVREGLKNLPDKAALEDTLSDLENRARLQEFHRAAVENAVRVITDSAHSFHEEIYPKIESKLGTLLSRVTLGAHTEVRVLPEKREGAPTLMVRVQDAVKGAPVPPEALSRGALEQVYLCLRLALVEAFTDEESLPVMLDDPFINYDDFGRLEAGVDLLCELARRHQVFLLTCQQNVSDYARSAGARIITL